MNTNSIKTENNFITNNAEKSKKAELVPQTCNSVSIDTELQMLESTANINKGALAAASDNISEIQKKLRERLEDLNVRTALHFNEDNSERFGKEGIESILKHAIDKNSISIINAKLDEVEQGKPIFTYDIIKEFKGDIMNLLDEDSFSHTSPLGRKISGPIKELVLEKSTIPEVIELEKRMKKLGYNVNFGDNLETAKTITKAYENLTQKGINMPDEIVLFTPSREGILGFRPYTRKGNEFQTPILFNKDLTREKDDIPFMLEQYGIKYNATDTPESVIYHEIGHFLHDFTQPEPEEAMEIWRKYANNGYDIDLAKEVGYYAMTGDKFNMGREYVAEVFAGVMEGKQYSERVMDLYYKLGGPKLN